MDNACSHGRKVIQLVENDINCHAISRRNTVYWNFRERVYDEKIKLSDLEINVSTFRFVKGFVNNFLTVQWPLHNFDSKFPILGGKCSIPNRCFTL